MHSSVNSASAGVQHMGGLMRNTLPYRPPLPRRRPMSLHRSNIWTVSAVAGSCKGGAGLACHGRSTPPGTHTPLWLRSPCVRVRAHLCVPVGDKLHPQHEPAASHVANDGMLLLEFSVWQGWACGHHRWCLGSRSLGCAAGGGGRWRAPIPTPPAHLRPSSSCPPTRAQLAWSPSSSTARRTARPAALDTGLPPATVGPVVVMRWMLHTTLVKRAGCFKATSFPSAQGPLLLPISGRNATCDAP